MARALNVDLWFFKSGFFYITNFFTTLYRIIKERPSKVIIQLPQGILLFYLVILKNIFNIDIIADVHTGFLIDNNFKSNIINRPFIFCLKYCEKVLVHNQNVIQILPEKLAHKTMVVYDPWYLLVPQSTQSLNDEKYMVIPCSFRDDEPTAEILESIIENNLKIKFYVTGNWKVKPSIIKYSRDNIIFTGYISQDMYEDLLQSSSGIITGTKDEYTALISAWEAVAYKKPLIVTETYTIKNLLREYPVYFDYHDKRDIAEKILMSQCVRINEDESNRLYNIARESIDSLRVYLNKQN